MSQGSGWWSGSGSSYPGGPSTGDQLSPVPSYESMGLDGPVSSGSPRSVRTAVAVLIAFIAGGVLGVMVGVGIGQKDSSSSDVGDDRQSVVAASDGELMGDEGFSVEKGFTTSLDSTGTRRTSAGALVTNLDPGLAVYDVRVIFNLEDADGRVIDTDSANVPYIPKGATVPVAPLSVGFDIAAQPAELRVLVSGRLAPDTAWDGVEFLVGKGIDVEVAEPEIVENRYSTNLKALVTNEGDEILDYASWMCVMRSGGVITGGESSSVSERLPPGATVMINYILSVGVPAEEVICRGYG